MLARAPEPSSSFKIDHSAVEDFYILLDTPHKSWLPGEEISGQVILISRRHLANIAIVFLLSGYVKINALPHSKLRAVKHTLFNHTIKIYGQEDSPGGDGFSSGLYKGEHRFPFIVKLPNKRVFTSIDFGKGAIVYVLKTSLRSADGGNVSEGTLQAQSPGPVSSDLLAKARSLSRISNPTFTSEKFINLVNPIDVGSLPPPKPKRLIINDPRRNRKLLRVQSSTSTINTHSTHSSANSDSESQTASMGTSQANTPSLLSNTHISPGTSGPSSFSAASEGHRPSAIRVSMEISQRGYLRGELIPIKLTINHLKKIQDSKGIIVTLVRVCRLDYGPDGLYESFRKDLQQLVIPLFVDPGTFLLEINTSLRIPADAFPTISGCPMVSFQYFIEVMLNLSGKSLSLDGPSDHPKSNLAPPEDMISNGSAVSPGGLGNSNYNFHPFQNRSEFINTDKFKRLKKFLQITTEVIIGTFRLEPRSSGVTPLPEASTSSTPEILRAGSLGSTSTSAHSGLLHILGPPLQLRGTPGTIPESGPMDDSSIPPYLESSSSMVETGRTAQFNSIPLFDVPTYEDISGAVPIPEQPQITEKERMRLHEASLLPSEPQFDADSDDQTTVSPMDPDSEILHNMIQGQENLELSSNGEAIGTDRFNFFAAHSLPAERTQEMLVDGDEDDDDDDLYDSGIHEGIGLEGASDYVPNYDSSANDRLVISERQPREQQHQSGSV